MKSDIEKVRPGAEILLVEGGGGVFDVQVDGEVIFSKARAHRFPTTAEIVERLK